MLHLLALLLSAIALPSLAQNATGQGEFLDPSIYLSSHNSQREYYGVSDLVDLPDIQADTEAYAVRMRLGALLTNAGAMCLRPFAQARLWRESCDLRPLGSLPRCQLPRLRDGPVDGRSMRLPIQPFLTVRRQPRGTIRRPAQ